MTRPTDIIYSGPDKPGPDFGAELTREHIEDAWLDTPLERIITDLYENAYDLPATAGELTRHRESLEPQSRSTQAYIDNLQAKPNRTPEEEYFLHQKLTLRARYMRMDDAMGRLAQELQAQFLAGGSAQEAIGAFIRHEREVASDAGRLMQSSMSVEEFRGELDKRARDRGMEDAHVLSAVRQVHHKFIVMEERSELGEGEDIQRFTQAVKRQLWELARDISENGFLQPYAIEPARPPRPAEISNAMMDPDRRQRIAEHRQRANEAITSLDLKDPVEFLDTLTENEGLFRAVGVILQTQENHGVAFDKGQVHIIRTMIRAQVNRSLSRMRTEDPQHQTEYLRRRHRYSEAYETFDAFLDYMFANDNLRVGAEGSVRDRVLNGAEQYFDLLYRRFVEQLEAHLQDAIAAEGEDSDLVRAWQNCYSAHVDRYAELIAMDDREYRLAQLRRLPPPPALAPPPAVVHAVVRSRREPGPAGLLKALGQGMLQPSPGELHAMALEAAKDAHDAEEVVNYMEETGEDYDSSEVVGFMQARGIDPARLPKTRGFKVLTGRRGRRNRARDK